MFHRRGKGSDLLIAILLALGFLAGTAVLSGHPTAAAAGAKSPFADLAGWWGGDGQIVHASGNTESIRCRTTYFVENDGNTLKQNLRCASASYKLEIKSVLNNKGGTISGTWNESTYKVGGSVSGRATAGQINLTVAGGNFSASMSISQSGQRQTVVIRPQGFEISKVTISARKG